jgi:hypothetical protein
VRVCGKGGVSVKEIAMTENPYASPTDESAPLSQAMRDREFCSARGVFIAWEKLRITYVAVLALVTVLILEICGRLTARILFVIVEGALVANVLYFAGPAVEAYLRWLGYHRQWPRWLMFIAGTLLSIALTIAVLTSELLPDQH